MQAHNSKAKASIPQLRELIALAKAKGISVASHDDDVTIGELYEACHLRVPVAEAHLPHRDDALGVAVMAVLDGLRLPLRDLLKQRVSSVYEGIEGA